MKKNTDTSRVVASHLSFLLLESKKREMRLVERLRTLVEVESPSGDKVAVDRALDVFAPWAAEAGGEIRRHKHRNYGDSLEVRFGSSSSGEKPILLLGHLDTVWDHGTLAGMPWKATREVIAGPGVLDMKAGVMMALTAVEMLKDLHLLQRPITILLHGDEEIGSPASRKVTESVAKNCSAVYVLEPAQGDIGAYKTARKAVGMYRLTVRGIAAHSGVDFESGHSAVAELARQIDTLSRFTDLRRGITVNPGVISGGTRSNVIAAEAWVEIDVRLARSRDMAMLDRKFKKLKSYDKFCALELTGGVNRPPMERTQGTVKLFRRAKELAAQMNFDLEEAATGGGSDGNFTSALGVPTLDGMGAVGSGAHALHEHLERRYLIPRTALLAAMLM
jgi:glutamate carboxypeptidase